MICPKCGNKIPNRSIFFIVCIIIAICSGTLIYKHVYTPKSASLVKVLQYSNTSTMPIRQVTGVAADLGAGSFLGGADIQPGLYDVTPVNGAGNFNVTSKIGYLKINEILGDNDGLGVPEVRVEILDQDVIKLDGINKVHFQPVETPFRTTVKSLSLYTGIFVVGEDIAAGKYVTTSATGSGNFEVYTTEGVQVTNEVLGGDVGVKEVIVDLQNQEFIKIVGIKQVRFVPTN
jgi:hypothetical protein